MIEVRPATTADAIYIARNLRRADFHEITLSSLDSPEDIVVRSAVSSEFCWVATVDSTPTTIWGVVELAKDLGSPWMLGTDLMMKHRKVIMRESYRYAKIIDLLYPRQINFVHAANTASIRWLKALGFTLGDTYDYGPFNQPFIHFQKNLPCANPQPSLL